MSRAISYSLFGYEKGRQKDCFSFESYLRGFHINIRFNRIIYPEWITVLNLDEETYNSPYKPIFDWHAERGYCELIIRESGALCRNMLWRLETVFEYIHPEWKYSHVICRDLDSISTYREAQMVQEWVNEDKAIHCITDSVSHDIAMLGGLCGFRPGYVNDILGVSSHPDQVFDKLMAKGKDINFSIKGSDQKFLMDHLYNTPLAQHATEHFIIGRYRDRKEENGRHYRVDETLNIGVPEKFKETNLLAGHAGAAGFYEAQTMKFLYWSDPHKEDYYELETMKGFEQIFYYQMREDLR